MSLGLLFRAPTEEGGLPLLFKQPRPTWPLFMLVVPDPLPADMSYALTPVAVQGLLQYTGMVSFQAVTVPRQCRCSLRWFTNLGAQIRQDDGAFVTDAMGSWTQTYVTVLAPANATTVSLIAEVAKGLPAEQHLTDARSILQGGITIWDSPINVTAIGDAGSDGVMPAVAHSDHVHDRMDDTVRMLMRMR